MINCRFVFLASPNVGIVPDFHCRLPAVPRKGDLVRLKPNAPYGELIWRVESVEWDIDAALDEGLRVKMYVRL